MVGARRLHAEPRGRDRARGGGNSNPRDRDARAERDHDRNVNQHKRLNEALYKRQMFDWHERERSGWDMPGTSRGSDGDVRGGGR